MKFIIASIVFLLSFSVYALDHERPFEMRCVGQTVADRTEIVIQVDLPQNKLEYFFHFKRRGYPEEVLEGTFLPAENAHQLSIKKETFRGSPTLSVAKYYVDVENSEHSFSTVIHHVVSRDMQRRQLRNHIGQIVIDGARLDYSTSECLIIQHEF